MNISDQTRAKCKAYGITKRGAVATLAVLSESHGYSRRRGVVVRETAKHTGSSRVTKNGIDELLNCGFIKEKITSNDNVQLQIESVVWNRDISEIQDERRALLDQLKNSRRWLNPKSVVAKARNMAEEKRGRKPPHKAVRSHLNLIMMHHTAEKNSAGCVRFKEQTRHHTDAARRPVQDPQLELKPEANPNRHDYVFEFCGIEKPDDKLDKIASVILESLNNSDTGRLSLDVLLPLVVSCLQLDDWYNHNTDGRRIFEKRFFSEIDVLRRQEIISQSYLTVTLLKDIKLNSSSSKTIEKAEKGSHVPTIALPELPEENFTDEMPEIEDEEVEHDDETLELLGVLAKDEELSNKISVEADEGRGDELEPDPNVLSQLSERLSHAGGDSIRITNKWGELILEASPSDHPFLCSIKNFAHTHSIMIKVFLPMVQESVWDILQMAGDNSFISSVAVMNHDGDPMYALKKEVDIQHHSLNQASDIVMQVLTEATDVNDLIYKVIERR